MDILFYVVERFKLLYRISPECWLLIVVLFIMIWSDLMILLFWEIPIEKYRNTEKRRRGSKLGRVVFMLNLILMLVGLATIFLVTFIRRGSSEHRIILIPLRVLFGHRAPGDYWHVTVMNIVLYVPFACGLCFVIRKKCIHPVGASLLICFVLAFIAEVLQYAFGSGMAEVDDVLMNTLGGAIGIIPYVITSKIHQHSS